MELIIAGLGGIFPVFEGEENVIRQKGAHLVSRDQGKFPGFPRRGDGDSETVGVGIRGHYHIGIFPDPQFDGHFQGGGFLGVWEGDGGEIAVSFALFGHGYYLEPQAR